MQPVQSVQSVQQAEPTTTSESSLFITADQAAQIFGYSPDHIRRAIRKRLIPGIKVGDSYRVFRSFVENVVSEMEAGRFVDFDNVHAAQATISEGAA
jgi:excisionase family DNA binding protein